MTMWPTVPLGELCTIELGATPPRAQPRFWDKERATGNVWLSIADLPIGIRPIVSNSKEHLSDEGAARGKVVKRGTLLVSFKLTLGRLAFAGCDLRTNEAIAALTIKNASRITQEYLYWYLTYFDWSKAAEGEDKVKGKTLNKAKLKELSVLVPPLEEQRRIVTVLDEAFAAIATATANAEKNLANAQELFTCLVEEILDSVNDCQTMTLIAAADETCSLSYGIVQPGDEQEGGLPIVRPTDLQQKYIELGKLKRIAPELAYAYQRTKLHGDELLLCVRGTTGVLSVATPELAGGNVTRGIVPIRFEPTTLSDKLGYYLLKSESVQKQIKAATYGTALMQINIRDLKQIKLRVPPLARQSALVARLDAAQAYFEQLEHNCVAKLDAIASLKQSLLQRAFNGEVSSNFSRATAV